MAQRDEYELKIPASRTRWADRLAFALAAREKLRRAHNAMGARFRAGEITRAEWDAYISDWDEKNTAVLRRAHNAMGARFRAGEITRAEWDAYISDWDEKNTAVSARINELKQSPPADELDAFDEARDLRIKTASRMG